MTCDSSHPGNYTPQWHPQSDHLRKTGVDKLINPMHAQCHTPQLAVITLPICPLGLTLNALIFTLICNFMSWLHTKTLSPSNVYKCTVISPLPSIAFLTSNRVHLTPNPIYSSSSPFAEQNLTPHAIHPPVWHTTFYSYWNTSHFTLMYVCMYVRMNIRTASPPPLSPVSSLTIGSRDCLWSHSSCFAWLTCKSLGI